MHQPKDLDKLSEQERINLFYFIRQADPAELRKDYLKAAFNWMYDRKEASCVWDQVEPAEGGNIWLSSCGLRFSLYEDAPSENSMHFCPKCGRPIDEMKLTIPGGFWDDPDEPEEDEP